MGQRGAWLPLMARSRGHQPGRDLVQSNQSRCVMSSRREQQLALFGLARSTAGKRQAPKSITVDQSNEPTGQAASTLVSSTSDAAPTAAPNRSGRSGSRVPARASRSDAAAPLTRVGPTEQSAPSGAAPITARQP